jgi:oligoribonuclease NrnB/cAMP/cGMP phosphodiesterase (DHH superfamily)
LPEPYLTYYRIALRFGHKALLDEQDDLLHDIIEGLARVAKDRTLSEAAMYRIAEHIKDHYWYKHYAYHNGLDCQHCSKAQRAECRTAWAYSDWAYYDCRRAITLESINQPIIDSEGNITELAELIADDRALDLEEWLDAKTFLIGAPIRLKQIARKLNNKVEALTVAERKYLCKLRRKTQETLV